jgi:Pyruvate/2-oxoacid:ferredoxin oxidoreductase delta subunit
MRPFIIKERCAAQQNICPPMKECVNNAIFYIVDEEELLGGRIQIDYEKCEGCGKCVDICCGHCIEMR